MQRLALLILCALLQRAAGQTVTIREASPTGMPVLVDSNSPLFWREGRLSVFTSIGDPLLFNVADQDEIERGSPGRIATDTQAHYPMWIESVWQDDDGTLYAWYHHEPQGLCSGSQMTAPEIGALMSVDGGVTFDDLGIVLSSGDPIDCAARNAIFAGGHGDFTVIPDRERRYFYFLFGNYGGDASGQGVAIARMAFEDRAHPAGMVWKYREGEWNERGLGGRMTPVFPAGVPWQQANTQALWGPSVHWNTALQSYVVLLNHACCAPKWPQEGIYLSFNRDLSDPRGWSAPRKILDARELIFGAGYYPQVLGLGPGETDTVSGARARLYVNGYSRWEIDFVPANAPLREASIE
jgi:hypothetical protein